MTARLARLTVALVALALTAALVAALAALAGPPAHVRPTVTDRVACQAGETVRTWPGFDARYSVAVCYPPQGLPRRSAAELVCKAEALTVTEGETVAYCQGEGRP